MTGTADEMRLLEIMRADAAVWRAREVSEDEDEDTHAHHTAMQAAAEKERLREAREAAKEEQKRKRAAGEAAKAERRARFEQRASNLAEWFAPEITDARNLASISQRAMIAARLASLPRGGREQNADAPLTRSEASKLFGVGRGTIVRATAVLARGIPELVEAVERGAVTVTHAVKAAELAPEAQRMWLARFDESEPDELEERLPHRERICVEAGQ